MRMEVHIHGSIFLGRGVRLSQVEHALRPWLEYLDVETIAEAPSLEREEPGIVFDSRERTVNVVGWYASWPAAVPYEPQRAL